MATIVNTTPAQTDSSSNGMGFLIGVMLLVLLVMVVLFYGLPYLRSSISVPQVNVPGQIDVNVNQPEK